MEVEGVGLRDHSRVAGIYGLRPGEAGCLTAMSLKVKNPASLETMSRTCSPRKVARMNLKNSL